MEIITLTELTRNTSDAIRRANGGEILVITDRGQARAILCPTNITIASKSAVLLDGTDGALQVTLKLGEGNE